MLEKFKKGILSDIEIERLCKGETPMISPFETQKIRVSPKTGKGVISYGSAEYGYDIRLGEIFKRPQAHRIGGSENSLVYDPKNPAEEMWEEFQETEPFILEPNSIILVQSREYFRMPNNVVGIVAAKSTYSRIGLGLPLAILEPGWHGIPTIRVANLNNNPIRIYPNEGFAQVLFFAGINPASTYGNGKYQGQVGVTLPKV